MNRILLRNLVLTTAGLLAAQVACAAETGFYVGGFYGISEKSESNERYEDFTLAAFDAPVSTYLSGPRSTTLDSRSTSYGFIGGYRLFENFAVEGGYMRLGTSKYRDRSNGFYSGTPATEATPLRPDVPASFLVNVDNQIGGIALSALGILPISYRWEVYGRAGVMFATHDFKFFFNDNLGGPGIKDEFSESATDLLAGVGASFMLAEVYTLRAEFIRVFKAGNEDLTEGDVDILSVGVTVKF